MYRRLIALAIIGLSPLGCHSDSSSTKIGALLCLSGVCAEWGTNSLRGAQLAVEEINARGGLLGRPIELVVEDSQEQSASLVLSGFRNLQNDPEIDFILGPTWSNAGKTLAPIAANGRQLMMSPSLGIREFNEAGKNLFNIWPHDEYSSQALARYAVQKEWLRAGIISSIDPWEDNQAQAFQNEFLRLGGTVTASIEAQAISGDLRAETLRVKASNPQVVLLSNYRQMDLAARELRKLGFSGQIFSTLMDDDRIKAAQGAFNGAIFCRYAEPQADFRERFQKRFGSLPGITSERAYDAIQLYAKSVQSAGTSAPAAVGPILGAVRNYHGASGTLSFDENRGVQAQPEIWVVSGESTLFYSKAP